MAVPQPVRRGATLPELLVGLTILAILGTGIVRLAISQMRSVDRQVQQRAARAASRAPVNFLLSELRMVEPGGVLAATPRAIELRVPYALGLACGSAGGATVVSVLPSDSATYTGVPRGAYAWRTGPGGYVYVDSGLVAGAGDPAGVCAAAGIVTLPGGRLVSVRPPLPAAAPIPTPVFLVQRLRYWFGPSADVPGATALFRTRIADGATEELASPLDSTARFRFHRAGTDSVETNPPVPLSDLVGIEVELTGLSSRPRLGGTGPERATRRMSIFFANAVP